MNILGISGSLRKASYNTAALRTCQALLPAGVTLEIASLADIPLYDQDQRDLAVPAAVLALVARIKAADALLFAAPEYNYSISGVLKNAIDWVSRETPQPFAGKPAAILSASKSLFGGARAQYDLRKIGVFQDLHFLNKPEVMIIQAHQRFDANDALTDEATRQHLEKLVVALVAWTKKLNGVAA